MRGNPRSNSIVPSEKHSVAKNRASFPCQIRIERTRGPARMRSVSDSILLHTIDESCAALQSLATQQASFDRLTAATVQCLRALTVAKARGLVTVALLEKDGGQEKAWRTLKPSSPFRHGTDSGDAHLDPACPDRSGGTHLSGLALTAHAFSHQSLFDLF